VKCKSDYSKADIGLFLAGNAQTLKSWVVRCYAVINRPDLITPLSNRDTSIVRTWKAIKSMQ